MKRQFKLFTAEHRHLKPTNFTQLPLHSSEPQQL